MDDTSHTPYRCDHTAPGHPLRTARNAAEWSGLVLAVLGLVGFSLYVYELLVGMF
ncbi:hypothetical protein ATDW_06830 [Asticcacaulis sp. DW145]|uniref:hypothetical protein n=1 Tax=Asticcacaulis sp. DW145 TaxID=3095608 RepID=UPI0030887311|nr:hypothetical protein ATDW_06830 [Asticcacaulis sp. DW145]